MIGFLADILSLLEFLGFDSVELQAFFVSPIFLTMLPALSLLVFLSRRYGVGQFEAIIYLWRFIASNLFSLVTRKRILVYIDADDTNVLFSSVKKHLKDLGRKEIQNRKMVRLRTGDDFVGWPLSTRNISAVIVIITDVTKLSNDKRRREIIQRKLCNFVSSGGCAIFTHDAIYRRVKNDKLQKLVGGKIVKFVPTVDNVIYRKYTGASRKSAIQFDDLPDQFSLRDGEVVHGNWEADVEYLYTCANFKEEIPLVTRRVVGKGVVYWMNSGDTSADGPPHSIAQPDENFVRLLLNALKNC